MGTGGECTVTARDGGQCDSCRVHGGVSEEAKASFDADGVLEGARTIGTGRKPLVGDNLLGLEEYSEDLQVVASAGNAFRQALMKLPATGLVEAASNKHGMAPAGESERLCCSGATSCGAVSPGGERERLGR